MADNQSEQPVASGQSMKKTDQLVTKFVGKSEKVQGKISKTDDEEDKDQPAGGFDDTPVPKAPVGYTIKITFHRAENLPVADINTLSSDPYVKAVLRTSLTKRHKQDPDLTLRTPTIHKSTEPTWDTEWIIANIPSSGFKMKCRLYDEDPADKDDRLGNAHIDVSHIDDNWQGFKEKKFELKKRMGSKRAYLLKGAASLLKGHKIEGFLIVSVENLGKSDDEHGGRAYTIGPLAWSRHFSPLIGRLVGTKDPDKEMEDGKNNVGDYNFQALQFQLRGPVPESLYHRYVEFKPFVAGMFTSHTLRGKVLNHALHHQHSRIYNYNKSTKYGIYQEPSIEMTKMFLDFVHYDIGGRIYTYVVTLDGHWRFTETGKEFGIDLLSKHTMHSNVNIYIAFSGEFFIRRLKHPRRDQSPNPDPETKTRSPAREPDEEKEGEAKEPPKDPSNYEMVIDNDSGTYRPNAKLLDDFRQFMSDNLPGLRIVTLDCQADEEKMGKLKDEQRERKKESGNARMTYLQNRSASSLDSSVSSSDLEELDQRAEGRPYEHRYKREMHKYLGHGQDEFHDEGEGRGGEAAHEGQDGNVKKEPEGTEEAKTTTT